MDEKRFEEIQDYLDGTMSREEQLRFEAELKTSEELSSTLHLYRLIEEEMRNDATQNGERLLTNSLEKLNKKYFRAESQQNTPQTEHYLAPAALDSEPPAVDTATLPTGGDHGRTIRINVIKKIAIAAVSIGIIAIGTVWILQNKRKAPEIAVNNKKADTPKRIPKSDTISPNVIIPPNNVAKSGNNKTQQPTIEKSTTTQLQSIDRKRLQALYARFAKPDELPGQRLPALEDGDERYESGDYREAIVSYNEAIERTKVNTRGKENEKKKHLFYASYYKAQSYLAMDSVTKAIPDLNQAMQNSPDDFWKSKTQWYLALAYLKTNEVQKAEALLKQVASNREASEYREKAQELTKELSSTKHKEK
jgi:tetratricopeptide (TPR) repeat protein